MRVEVYRNLHTGTWSVRDIGVGRVVAHPNEVQIANASFVVRKAGRERVLSEKRKNVHAFVRGDLINIDKHFASDSLEDMNNVRYNPYEAGSFVDTSTGEPVETSEFVYMSISDGVFYL